MILRAPFFRFCTSRCVQFLWLPSNCRFFTSKPRKTVRSILRAGAESLPQDAETVTVEGWIKAVRHLKNASFFHVDDGSSVTGLQVLVDDIELRKLPLTFGSSLRVTGKLVASPKPKQPVELRAQEIVVLQENDPEKYPFKIKEKHHLDYYRQYLNLRLRTEHFASMMRVRNAASMAIHKFFQEREFFQVHTPIITSNDCEGAGEPFKIQACEVNQQKTSKEFFDCPVTLTVSGQLHLEAAMCGLMNVYNFNPAFRAERQQSRRHLSEFWMVEAEVAFMESLDDLLELEERMLKSITRTTIEAVPEDFNYHLATVASSGHEERIKTMLEKPFVRVPYWEAIEILMSYKDNLSTPPKNGENLHRDHELWLVRHFDDVPVFVTHFPATVKPFYARQDPAHPGFTLTADLIVPDVGELYGGSLREHNVSVLEERCRKQGCAESLSWYLDLRRYGGPPSGGFGMGFERYIQYLLGIASIKDAIPFPRWIDNCAM